MDDISDLILIRTIANQDGVYMTISLPHITVETNYFSGNFNPSLSLSIPLSGDLISRLSNSHEVVRKGIITVFKFSRQFQVIFYSQKSRK